MICKSFETMNLYMKCEFRQTRLLVSWQNLNRSDCAYKFLPALFPTQPHLPFYHFSNVLPVITAKCVMLRSKMSRAIVNLFTSAI